MAAYYIVEIDIQDQAKFEEYRQKVPQRSPATAGATWCAAATTRRSRAQPKRIVVLEFPTVEQAKRWYDSPEYRPLKELRRQTAHGHIVLVEGVA
jgi:uncharacterized protein (DUF1330 family)